MTSELNRSWLFAPATEPRKMEKALASSADQVVFDLEDAVPPEQKETALSQILELGQNASRSFYVRINGLNSDRCYKEFCALAPIGITPNGIKGFVIPKIESPAHCAVINWLVAALEKEYGLANKTLKLLPVIETAAAFARLNGICANKGRIDCLSFGAWDLSLDLNMRYKKDEQNLHWAKNELAIASRAGGLDAPIDSSYIYLQDEAGLQDSIRKARDLGYQGKACIHPNQIEPVNQGFSPSAEEYDWASQVVTAFDDAVAKGLAAVRVADQFVDYPMYQRAQKIIKWYEVINKEKESGT